MERVAGAEVMGWHHNNNIGRQTHTTQQVLKVSWPFQAFSTTSTPCPNVLTISWKCIWSSTCIERVVGPEVMGWHQNKIWKDTHMQVTKCSRWSWTLGALSTSSCPCSNVLTISCDYIWWNTCMERVAGAEVMVWHHIKTGKHRHATPQTLKRVLDIWGILNNSSPLPQCFDVSMPFYSVTVLRYLLVVYFPRRGWC